MDRFDLKDGDWEKWNPRTRRFEPFPRRRETIAVFACCKVLREADGTFSVEDRLGLTRIRFGSCTEASLFAWALSDGASS
jgi:hypothetical protein